MRNRGHDRRAGLALAVILAALGTLPAFGQAPAAPPAPPAYPDFAATVKDMQTAAGMVTFYYNKADDPTKDQTRLLCQIPKSLLKQDLLLATSMSRGEMAGYTMNDYLIRFEMVGKQVVINTPDARFVQTPGQPISEAVSRTYNDGFLAALPIVTLSPGGDPVVDLGATLMDPSTLMQVNGLRPRRELSEFSKIKAFPDNALVEVTLAVSGPGGSGQRVGLFYALRRLPDARAYTPRLADERAGYFTTVRQDWGQKYSERETIIRYVNRWELKKKDASLEMSPPEKPITFIVEKTVPLQWRKSVADGILEWNRAFEKLGIVNAIVVNQQTDENEFAQVDPEDARYNFFRWIVTGSAFAMGPSRADPRTGQILDADIIFDDSFVRALRQSANILGPGAAAAIYGPELAQFLRSNPEFLPAGHTLEELDTPAVPGAAIMPAQCDLAGAHKSPWAASRHSGCQATCGYASGLQQQIAFAHLFAAAAAPGGKLPDRLLGETIKEIACHEVGHTLGLRHNFKASSWLTLEEIKTRRDNTDEALVSSVMDYTGMMFLPGDDPSKLRHIITPTIGPYDYWVIEYGYKIPGKDDGDEKTMLAKIASQCTRRELAYATDEDTMGLSSPDPYANRYDLGDDPIAWARARAALAETLLKDVKKWALKSDEPTEYLRDAVEVLLREKSRNVFYVSRLVGGQQFNRNRIGDPQAKPAFVLLDPKKQREAIAMMAETVFRDDYFLADADLFNELAPSRWWDWASTPTTRVDFPVHQAINSLQAYALLTLCSPQILERIYDAELKSRAEDKFTAAELITSVSKAIWGGLEIDDNAKFDDAHPMLTSIRRNLQVQHLQYLLAIADSNAGRLTSPDLQNMVRFALRDLSGRIGKVLTAAKTDEGGSRLDFATRGHLTECKSRIDRVLESPHIRMPSAGIMILGAEAQPSAKR